MIHPITAEELAALNALMAGPRTVRDVAAKVGRNAWAILRSMELREPALVERDLDRGTGEELWSPTPIGVAARSRASPRVGAGGQNALEGLKKTVKR